MAETAAAYIFKVVASTALKAGASKAAAAFLAKSAVFAAKVGLTVGASAALNAAFAPRVSTPDSRIAQRQPTPERAAAFGRVRSAGAYSLYSTSGGDSIDVLAFHDGRIAGIDQIYLHDDLVTLGTGPLGAGFVQGDSRTGQYFEAIYVDTRLGTANQSAFTRARSKVPGEWSSQHCMDGVAALELLCLGPKKERLPKVYPLGLPRPSVVYRAQYCFDFRQPGQSVENWRGWTPGSRNPVLQMVTYMCNPAVPDPVEPDRALGLGMDFDTEIAPHLDAWIAAANACDQLVPKKGGGTEPRYQCDFEYYVGEDPADTIARFLASCDGWLSETGDGALTIKVGAYDGSAVEINSDWVIAHAINRGVPDEQLKNVFVGFYTDPDKKFSQVEGAPWYDQGSIALTGKRRYERVPMTQVQSHGQLTRLLKRIALRRNAEARGTLRLSLPALDLMGERWLKFPMDFPNSEFLRGKIVEVEALEIDFSDGGAVILDWAIYDTDADTFDPDTEEGAAPPAPSESELSTPPVIDTGDVSAVVDTETRFGGQRQAVAVLTFPAPVRSYDIAGAGSVDVPRTDLGWRVRWRVRPSGGWTESAISGDVIEGDEVSGWTVRLRTPDLPRAALDLQIAAIGPRDDQGDWSDSVQVDVDAATAPSLAAPANVTATAALEESEGGVKRPALTVSFDPIASPEAQMVLVAIKPAGDPDSSFAQIDAVEPRLGGKTIYTIPYGRTVDVGLQTWAQWREPSDWAVVEGVVIPGEVGASSIGGLTGDELSESLAFLASINPALAGGLGIREQAGYINLFTDPLFALGVGEVRSPHGVVEIEEGAPRAISITANRSTGDELTLVLGPRFDLRAGARLAAACEVSASGSISDAALSAHFYDASDEEIGAGVTIASGVSDGARAAGFVESADIPASTAKVELRLAGVSDGTGEGRLAASELLAAYTAPQQSSVPAFVDPKDETVSRALDLLRVDVERAYQLAGLEYETSVSRALITVLQEVTANAARYQIATQYETQGGDTLSLIELLAADGESRILLLSGLLAFANTVVDGDPLVAMEVRNGIVHFLTEARLAEGGAFTHYTGDPAVLRICLGAHPDTGDIGIFLYDDAGDPLLEFNATDNVAKLYPGMAAEGFASLQTSGSRSDYDLTTDSSPRNPADFIDLSVATTGALPLVVNARYEIEVDYTIVAERDSFEWFTFVDQVLIEARTGGGAWTTVKDFGDVDQYFSTSSNTGQVPTNIGSTRTVPKRIQFVNEWVGAGVYDEVRAVLEIRADALGGASGCLYGSPNDTKITNSLKIAQARIKLIRPTPGPNAIL